MPDNTNTLNQSRFPAGIRPDIERIVFTGPATAGTSLHDLFHGLTNLSAIENIDYIDTAITRNIRRVFMDTHSLDHIDLSSWDTSSATNMYRMFTDSGVVTLDTSGWNTAAVTNFGSMFWGAGNLTAIIGADSWNTGSALRMSRMFQGASSLVGLNPSSWDTSSVTLMYNMFHNASSLTSLDLSGWDVSNVIPIPNKTTMINGDDVVY